MSSNPDASQGPDPEITLEPTDAEVERWAAQEHERREAWLHGPTDAQKASWAAQEHARRAAERGLGQARLPRPTIPTPSIETRRLAQYYIREAQLATEGAVSMFFNMSIRNVVDTLVQAGREWEDEYTSRPPRRRRVRLTDDAAEAHEAPETPASNVGRPPGASSQTG
jgi:hypothetical protein